MVLDIENTKRVFIFEMIRKSDNSGTYKAFSNAYFIKNGIRTYLSNAPESGFNICQSFCSDEDPYNDVKNVLNNVYGNDIKFMSQHQNVVVHCHDVKRSAFDRLTQFTKQKVATATKHNDKWRTIQ